MATTCFRCVSAAPASQGSDASPPLPLLDKSLPTRLAHAGGERWVLESNGTVLQNYTTDDLRMSIVYRARCFASADEASRFDGRGGPEEGMMTLEGILRTFGRELARRGEVASEEAAMAMDRLELGLLIINTFVRYPLPDRWQPFNYCALSRLWPSTAPLLRLVC